MELMTNDNQAIQVSEQVFDYNYNEGLIHQAVVRFMNNARSGNSAQKTRSEVRGGGKKPWNQKGTGRARAGTIRSPIWRSGGVTFASKKRDYSQKMNKKMYKRAICSIISELHRSGNLLIINEFNCDSNKTKNFLSKMKELNLDSALIIKPEIEENEYLSSRNLANYEVCDLNSIDPVILLRYEKVLITMDAVKSLEEQLQ